MIMQPVANIAGTKTCQSAKTLFKDNVNIVKAKLDYEFRNVTASGQFHGQFDKFQKNMI